MKKFLLVGDVGSTKSTWYVNGDPVEEIHLSGYNPLVHSLESGKKLFETLALRTSAKEISEIWYYGAGLIDHHVADEVKTMLRPHFPGCNIHAASDLTGAAISVCGYKAGTVAILGTGSHAAVFDGQKLIRQATALGFILGDEGGGCDIGKSLLQAYFYNEMPESIAKEMTSRIPGGRVEVLNQLKTSSTPNQYLAGFAQVAVLFQEHSWVKELVSARFKLFVNRHVVPLTSAGPVHVVGSIGCIFAGLIEQELKNNGLTAGIFLKDPARRLFEIHIEHERKEK